MSATVSIYAEDIDERIDTFTSIRLYRDSSPDGTFTTLAATVTLVAGQYAYTVTDSGGNADSWYQYQFYNPSTLTESDFSPPWAVQGGTLGKVRLLTAQQASNAFSGRTTAAGANLVDAELTDAGASTDFLAYSWVWRPDVAAADRIRRLGGTPFTVTTGTLTPRRTWATAFELAEYYEVYQTIPPKPVRGITYSWDQAVRDGLNYIWLIDEVVVGTGDDASTEFEVDTFRAVDRRRIRKVTLRSTASDGTVTEQDAAKNGLFWNLRENGGSLTLVLNSAPMNGVEVVVEIQRHPDLPWQDDDFVEVHEELAAAAGALAAYRYLNRNTATKGSYQLEEAGAMAEFERRYKVYAPQGAVIGL